MKKFMRFLVPLLMILVIIASIGWYLFVYDRDFTRDFLLSQARYQDMYGNSRLSAMFYNMAYEYSGRDENVAIELANQYKNAGNYTKAEVTLSNAIKSGGGVDLYAALCKTYVEQDKLLDAVNFLSNISDPTIRNALEQLRPTAPTANYEPGFYSQYLDLELSSSTGTLYYTTDGDYPSIANEPYSQPVSLPAGETTVYAISVGDNGLISPLTIGTYTIGGVIEAVEFKDKAMEEAMRSAINASSSEIIYTNSLWDITEFSVPEAATNLEDLALMPYLQVLTVTNQKLSDLECLSDLNKLQSLELLGCILPADSLSTVAQLPVLTSLSLDDCSLSSIAALAGAPSLTSLDLSNNTVRNLEALSGITTLRELNLQHNAVTDLSQLSGLNNLEKLDVSYNALTSLEPVSSCQRLEWLDASNNQITSLDGVNKLPLLSYLAVNHNVLTDISPAAQCAELTELRFNNNQVSDISSLSALIKLNVLDFSYNTVSQLPDWQEGCALRNIDGSHNTLTSIDNLNKLSQIAYVYMDYNQITNVDALASCYLLVQVNVYGNSIESVSALTEHDIIVNYNPT